MVDRFGSFVIWAWQVDKNNIRVIENEGVNSELERIGFETDRIVSSLDMRLVEMMIGN